MQCYVQNEYMINNKLIVYHTLANKRFSLIINKAWDLLVHAREEWY
jgi:hypothetical protein